MRSITDTSFSGLNTALLCGRQRDSKRHVKRDDKKLTHDIELALER